MRDGWCAIIPQTDNLSAASSNVYSETAPELLEVLISWVWRTASVARSAACGFPGRGAFLILGLRTHVQRQVIRGRPPAI